MLPAVLQATVPAPIAMDPAARVLAGRRVLMVVNAEWYFLLHWLEIARALRAAGADVTVVTGVERGLVEQITAAGFVHVALPLRRSSLNPWHELRTALALLRVYRRCRPEVVHHVTIKPVIYGTLAARALGVPTILNTVPGLGYMFMGRGVFGALRRGLAITLYRLALRGRRVRVIFQNDTDRDLFVSRRIVALSHASVVPGAGVDLDRFVVRPEPGGVPLVLFAARLLWSKGLGEFVQMAERLRTRGIAARCVVAGAPDTHNPEHVPLAIVRGWVDAGVVEWWGHRDDMPEVMAQAHVVVLPSRDPEGLPAVLVEAAACGRAIVTTPVPGCTDLVVDDVTGRLVPVGDVESLTEAVTTLLAEPARRRRYGTAARTLVEARFALPRIVRVTLDAYSAALADG